jgi:hypothetical protein
VVRKIKISWTWVDVEAKVFTTRPPSEMKLLPGDSLYKCTKKMLTSWSIDDCGWYPNHPLEFNGD